MSRLPLLVRCSTAGEIAWRAEGVGLGVAPCLFGSPLREFMVGKEGSERESLTSQRSKKRKDKGKIKCGRKNGVERKRERRSRRQQDGRQARGLQRGRSSWRKGGRHEGRQQRGRAEKKGWKKEGREGRQASREKGLEGARKGKLNQIYTRRKNQSVISTEIFLTPCLWSCFLRKSIVYSFITRLTEYL